MDISSQFSGRMSNYQPYTNTSQIPDHMNIGHANKSAFNYEGRLETITNFSQTLPKTYQTFVIPKPPESPKVEKEILSKLDEVNSQVTSWLKQLETKKGAELETGPKDLGKIKLNRKKQDNEEAAL